MNKRALLIAFHFPPQAASSGIQRTLSFSKNLQGHGWDPLVLTASAMAYSEQNPSQLKTLPAGLVVKRAFALDAKRHLGIMGRYPEALALPDRWVSWWLSAVPAGLNMIRQYQPSVIWSTFPIATAPLIGLTLQRLTGLPWVVDFRDPMLQPDFPTTKWQRKAYGWIEREALRRCQRAVFTTHSAKDAYKKRFPHISHDKFIVIENGYDEEGFKSAMQSVVESKCVVPSNKHRLTLLHSGVLYADGRDPSKFFEAVSHLKSRQAIEASSLRIVLRATGDDPYFMAMAKKFDIEDIVEIAPSIPYRDALHEMLYVDGLLVFQGRQFNNQIPAKIYEYFRARKPILGLIDADGETARVLGNAGFQDQAAMDSSSAIIPVLEQFIEKIRQGRAYVATDEVIFSSSRANRAAELAQVFHELAGSN